jgi:hypothetical protein
LSAATSEIDADTRDNIEGLALGEERPAMDDPIIARLSACGLGKVGHREFASSRFKHLSSEGNNNQNAPHRILPINPSNRHAAIRYRFPASAVGRLPRLPRVGVLRVLDVVA